MAHLDYNAVLDLDYNEVLWTTALSTSASWNSWSCSPSCNAVTTPTRCSIRHVLAERSHRRLARGALYTSLDRLEAKRLVTSSLGEPLAIRGGRARRYFTVTDTGLDALRGAREALSNLSRGLEGLLEKP